MYYFPWPGSVYDVFDILEFIKSVITINEEQLTILKGDFSASAAAVEAEDASVMKEVKDHGDSSTSRCSKEQFVIDIIELMFVRKLFVIQYNIPNN